MQNVVMISLDLAKDLWTLINDAKHPHHESKVVDQVKNGLMQLLRQSMAQEQKPQAASGECVKPEDQSLVSQEEVKAEVV